MFQSLLHLGFTWDGEGMNPVTMKLHTAPQILQNNSDGCCLQCVY